MPASAPAPTATEWEAAYEEYTDAQVAWDAAYPHRFRRGQRRAYRRVAVRLVAAKRALRELDAEFCDRLGIVIL